MGLLGYGNSESPFSQFDTDFYAVATVEFNLGGMTRDPLSLKKSFFVQSDLIDCSSIIGKKETLRHFSPN